MTHFDLVDNKIFFMIYLFYDPDLPELDTSPIDPTDSSWLKKDPPKDPPEESSPIDEWSDERMDRDVFVDDDAGDKERGAYPYSLK